MLFSTRKVRDTGVLLFRHVKLGILSCKQVSKAVTHNFHSFDAYILHAQCIYSLHWIGKTVGYNKTIENSLLFWLPPNNFLSIELFCLFVSDELQPNIFTDLEITNPWRSFPGGNDSLPSNQQPGLFPRWRGESNLPLQVHQTWKVRSSTIPGKSLCFYQALQYVAFGNYCPSSTLLTISLSYSFWQWLPYACYQLFCPCCCWKQVLVLPLAYALRLSSTILLVELKDSVALLVHFKCEANVSYNRLQRGILIQLLN